MTAVAAAMAGTIVAVTPKRAGRRLAAGNACAVFECGKFVGPAKVAFPAEIVRSNDAIMNQPGLAHTDPYGAAWLVALRPDDWRAAEALLTPGHKVTESYLELMRLANFAGRSAGC